MQPPALQDMWRVCRDTPGYENDQTDGIDAVSARLARPWVMAGEALQVRSSIPVAHTGGVSCSHRCSSRGVVMNDSAGGESFVSEDAVIANEGEVRYHKRDFWASESFKFVEPHFRMRKVAREVRRVTRGRECDLLDVGCGPATLASLMPPGLHYHGIDMPFRSRGRTSSSRTSSKRPSASAARSLTWSWRRACLSTSGNSSRRSSRRSAR
jgi:hypothetical protein